MLDGFSNGKQTKQGIVKAKARLVAKGFKQKYGVEYLETFSPTANAASMRLLVALACKYN